MGFITVSNLSKAYKQYPSRWARLFEGLLPFGKVQYRLKWVLKDLSFSVKPGQALGIVGINGAGKSTLLKMITGTVHPTEGAVEVTGRVAALLELGMGFHPDFTGRQNVLMAGQLLGYTVKELHSLMPEIEAFAEIGEYIDQPVRVYSSGMQMRLAFSVATARRPDVLIVDEALSVGDAYFQHKSFDRIRSFRKQGTTLLIVSHDKSAILSICDRAIFLNAGVLELEGSPQDVLDHYNAMLAYRGDNYSIEKSKQSAEGSIGTRSGTGQVLFKSYGLYGDSDLPVELVKVGQVVRLSLVVKSVSSVDDLVIGYQIKDRYGQIIFGTNTAYYKLPIGGLESGHTLAIEFKFSANLGCGVYSISVALHGGRTHVANNYEWIDNAIIFSVINSEHEEFIGCAWFPPSIQNIYLDNEKIL